MSFFGESEARYAALAGLVHDARVLDLSTHGDARCIDSLVTAGARSITVCAPENIRAQLTTRSADITLVPPITVPLPFSSSSFDVVICFDLVARMVQDATWAQGLREVLEPDGAIIIATASAEHAARVLGPTFGASTVFAQSPLVGHMIYDTEVSELEPELDRTWAEGDVDEPMTYMLVFAPDKRHTEKLTLVQMPFASWESEAREELVRTRAERDNALAELMGLREQMASHQRQLGSDGNASGETDTMRGDLENARREIELLVSELQQARTEANGGRGQDMSALEDELGRHRNDRASLEAQIADLLQESGSFSEHRAEWQARLDAVENELAGERARIAELAAQGVSGATQAAELEERLSREEARNVALDQEVAAERQRAAELERTLAEQGGSRERIAELEATLADERIKRRELEDSREQAREAEELMARARLETVDAVEALRQERVRGEQLLGRLVDLEHRLTPKPRKNSDVDGEKVDGTAPTAAETTNFQEPPGGEAGEGKS